MREQDDQRRPASSQIACDGASHLELVESVEAEVRLLEELAKRVGQSEDADVAEKHRWHRSRDGPEVREQLGMSRRRGVVCEHAGSVSQPARVADGRGVTPGA